MSTQAQSAPSLPSPQASPIESESGFGDSWKPMQKRERPTSQIAMSFSSLLDNAFHMTSDIEQLATSVNRRQTSVQLNTLELQALEAKLKLLEQKEKRLSRGVLPTTSPITGEASGNPSNESTGATSPPSQPSPREEEEQDPNPSATEQTKNEGEYVVVHRRDVVLSNLPSRRKSQKRPPPPVEEFSEDDEDYSEENEAERR